jgi:NDP-sugar pyrophosphorylase family protein
MILAGGLSTRLYPLTKQVPKPLVPVAGVPNAVHLVRYLKKYGYDEIAINVHYLATAIERTLGDGSDFGVRLTYLHEDVLMGSAGAVKAMQGYFGDDVFVVVGCDDLTDLPLDELVAMHRDRDAVATIGLVVRPDVEQYGVVVCNEDGRITGFQEKPARGTERSKLVNTGIYAFSPRIFDFIPANEFYDFGKTVFPDLLAKSERFYGFDARGAYWCDIGTPGEYRRASSDVVDGFFRIPDTRANGVDPTAVIATSARIDENVWIGARVRVGEHVRIAGPSVIGDDVTIEDGATLERSILWERASVGEGATLRDAVVGMSYDVAAGTLLNGAVVANEEVSTG